MDTNTPISIQGCPVFFPHKPYPSQMSMMCRIIQALDKKQNCLLESPTGTGKSLALLCATLAWLKRELDTKEKENLEKRRNLATGGVYINPEDCCPHCSTDYDYSDQFSRLNDATHASLEDSITEIKRKNEELCGQTHDPIVISDDEENDTEPVAKKFRSMFHDAEYDDDFQLDASSIADVASTSKMEEADESAKSVMKCEKECEETIMKNIPQTDRIPCDECSCHLALTVPESENEKKSPKIFYGTRTHNQIGQVVREMKRSKYGNMRSTVLSSREHGTCVNYYVTTQPRRKNEVCRELRKEGTCPHYETVKLVNNHDKLKAYDLEGAWEIEELIEALNKPGSCPYYVARELMSTADIIFCPYNYLIDPSFREAISLNLTNNIIIFDEAHNIEKCSCEASSFMISLEQLENAKADLQKLIKFSIKVEDHQILLKLVDNMLTVMELTKPRLIRQDFDEASLVWNGQEIVAIMDQVGIGPSRIEDVKKHFAAVIEEGNERDSANQRRQRKNQPKLTMEYSSQMLFESLLLCLNYIFGEKMKYRDDYFAALVQSTTYSREENTEAAISGMWLGKQRSRQSRVQEKQELTLNFWCMNPAVAFDVIGKSARTVILTSGTLSPLDSFASELSVEFPLRLEANHVVRSDQTLIGTIGTAPNGTALYGTYQNYMTYQYQDALGSLILSLCRVVPHGVLCFVPSYNISEKLIQRWEDTGMLSDLRRVKQVLVEPRGRSSDMASIIEDYYTCIRETCVRRPGGVSGAFLLAVCRGKMSEGQDFADNNARLVITVGIPYPSIKIPKVKLKQNYNDRRRKHEAGVLSGSQWYEVEAFRALNQALGRCIRHQNDWGAILMVDARLCNYPHRYMPSISKWLRQRVEHFESYSDMISRMEEFVDRRKELMANGEVKLHSRGSGRVCREASKQGTSTDEI